MVHTLHPILNGPNYTLYPLFPDPPLYVLNSQVPINLTFGIQILNFSIITKAQHTVISLPFTSQPMHISVHNETYPERLAPEAQAFPRRHKALHQ